MQQYNANPRMTRHLVEAGIFRDNKFVLVDVGAREGMHIRWQAFQDQLMLIGFEPDAAECARLNRQFQNGAQTFYPYALDS